MEYNVGGMTHVPSFMTIGLGIEVMIRLLPQHFERLQCWYYWLVGQVKYAIEIVSGGMIYTPILMISSDIQVILKLLP
jgi:hypothetical protein